MEKAGLVAKAEQLQALIDANETLVLPNVWDVAGAHIVVEAGYPVIATSSAGIAWSFGYADGENISRDDMLFMVRLIARSVDAPVTADMDFQAGGGGLLQCFRRAKENGRCAMTGCMVSSEFSFQSLTRRQNENPIKTKPDQNENPWLHTPAGRWPI